MYYFIFSIIVLISAVLGALAGIGGGVIIRPALDAINYFDKTSITNTISSFCVLFVALTSIGKRLISKNKFPNWKISLVLGIGAAAGGVLGQYLFSLVNSVSNKNILVIIQSSLLILLLIFVIIYMQFYQPKGVSLHIKNYIVILVIGLALGIISSFLGIGGGPINVAVLCLFFAMDIKEAAVNSLIVIIFSQVSKIIQSLIDGTLISLFDLNNLSANDQTWWIYLLVLIPVVVIGSLIGTYLNKKLSSKVIQILYIITMFVIIGINVYNIVSNAVAL